MRKYLFILLFAIMFLPFISSETSFFITEDSVYDIKISCDINGARCPAAVLCNLTSEYPNSSLAVDDGMMTNLGNGYYNYTFNVNQTSVSGEYKDRAECVDPNSNLNNTITFTHEVNPTGIRPSDQKTESITRGIYVIFAVSIMFFIAFLFVQTSPPVKWTFLGLAFIFFLIALNLISVSLADAVVNTRMESFFDSFTAISTIMYWFVIGTLAIMWFLTFLNTWLFKKNLKNAQRYGLG